jgi:hypothetical protein
MSQYNPYAPPQGPAAAYYQGGGAEAALEGAVPDEVVEPLRRTKGWVTFLAVVGFIGTGFMILGALFMVGAGKAIPGMPAWLGLFYLVAAAIYVAPSVLLLRYGSAITRLVRDPRMEQLTFALDRQRSFWKLVGVMVAVLVALYPIGLIVGIVFMASKVSH